MRLETRGQSGGPRAEGQDEEAPFAETLRSGGARSTRLAYRRTTAFLWVSVALFGWYGVTSDEALGRIGYGLMAVGFAVAAMKVTFGGRLLRAQLWFYVAIVLLIAGVVMAYVPPTFELL